MITHLREGYFVLLAVSKKAILKRNFNPFTPKISYLVLLLTVHHTICMMLDWRIWYLIN